MHRHVTMCADCRPIVAVWPKTQRTRVTIGVPLLFIPSCASGKVPLRTPSAHPDSSVTFPPLLSGRPDRLSSLLRSSEETWMTFWLNANMSVPSAERGVGLRIRPWISVVRYHGMPPKPCVAVWPKTQRTRVTIGVPLLFIPSCASGKVPLRTPSAHPDSSVTPMLEDMNCQKALTSP